MAEKFVADASKVVSLQLVKTPTDVDNRSLTFAPEFCHQFFGEHETIFGYEDLKVTLHCTFCSCQVYLKIKYKEACVAADLANVEPDDVLNCIQKLYPEHAVLSDYEKFLRAAENQHTFEPYGQLLHVYSTDKDNTKRDFYIYKVDKASKSDEFVKFYERIEMFAFWYIDAASCIDISDDRWQFYILYERYLDSSKRVCYGFVGYSSVYLYYAYPEHLKPRIGFFYGLNIWWNAIALIGVMLEGKSTEWKMEKIMETCKIDCENLVYFVFSLSHFLILPPFQKGGHGFHVLQTIYNDLVPNAKVLEIAAEDPAFNFVKLRDYVDATNCQKLRSFTPIKNLKINGFSKELVDEARSKLKIGKKQARRIYEILRLKATDTSNPDEYKAYRLDVKRRLYKPFKKSRKDWKNLNKVLTPEEATSTAASMTRENIHLALQSAFEQTTDEYRPVLDRLATYHVLPDVVLARTSNSSNQDCEAKNGHAA